MFMNSQWPRPLSNLKQLVCFSVLLSLASPPFIFYERPGQKVLGDTGKAFCPFLSDLYFNYLKFISLNGKLDLCKIK